jgi:hypothetical protein
MVSSRQYEERGDEARHCAERSDEAGIARSAATKQSSVQRGHSGLLRCARNDGEEAQTTVDRSALTPGAAPCTGQVAASR